MPDSITPPPGAPPPGTVPADVLALVEGNLATARRYDTERRRLDTHEQAQLAANHAAALVRARDRLDAWHKTAKAPALATATALDKARKALAEPLEAALEAAKARLMDYLSRANTDEPVVSDHGVQVVVRNNKVAEVTDPALLPRDLMVPDMKAIEARLRAGEAVPGARLATKPTIAIR